MKVARFLEIMKSAYGVENVLVLPPSSFMGNAKSEDEFRGAPEWATAMVEMGRCTRAET